MGARSTGRALVAAAAVAASAGLAGCVDYPPPPPPPRYGPPPPPPYALHVRRCFALHPNYDPRTNTWWDGWGYPHPCRA